MSGWEDDWGDEDDADDWGDDADMMDADKEDGGWADPTESTFTVPVAQKELSYDLLEKKEVRELMAHDVKKCASRLDLPEEAAELLLRQAKWNQAKVEDSYFSNPERAQSQAGIRPDPKGRGDWQSGERECPMCYDDYDAPGAFDHLPCGHQICKSCWSDYTGQAVRTKDCVNLRCSYHVQAIGSRAPKQCPIKVPRGMFERYLKPDSLARYEKFILGDYVDNNKKLKWCPAPNCEICVKIDDQTEEVKCFKSNGVGCGHIFCVRCNHDGHRPSPCEAAEQWRIKCSSESENIQYIMARTKKCPKCSVHIEKNQGCNHMTCRNCGHEFCWLCKGDWKKHGSATGGYYKCNIFEKNKASGAGMTDEEKKMADAKNALEKYMFYLTRYENHVKSIGFAKKTKTETERRMDEMAQRYNWKPNEATFLMEAVDTVIECRRLLAWTYPIGYYLAEYFPKKALFEDLQQQLEKYTEHLHELSERDTDKLADNKVRQEVKNYTRCTQKFRDNMVKGVEEEINVFFDDHPLS